MIEEAEKKSKHANPSTRHRDRGSYHRKRFEKPRHDSSSDSDSRHKHRRRSHENERRSNKHHRSEESRRGHNRASGSSLKPKSSNSGGWRKPTTVASSTSTQSESVDNPVVLNIPKKKLEDEKFEYGKLRKETEAMELSMSEKEDSPDSSEEKSSQVQLKVLTEKEMNELNAKLLKAEMLGNSV